MARLLVVDDDASVRESMCALLSLRGHEVESARDGRAALDRLEQAPTPDCMVLDMHMPRLGGIGVLEALESELPRVVVLSAFEYVSRVEVEERFAARVCAFLVKPVPPPDLVRTVEGCLART
jgi:CheY-like chemotaxis protein